MLGLLRLLLGLLLLPACWGVVVALGTVIGGYCRMSVSSLSFLGGMVAFIVCWVALPHPMRTYVLGHELTHALWGLCFGAKPSRLRVRDNGGSVNLTKTNLLITLAPYFFPFYTFVVIVIALITLCFVNPLPWWPLWLFAFGFTWTFHILFTFDSLRERQPDIRIYGRIFSWIFIFLVNALVLLAGVVILADVGLSSFFSLLGQGVGHAYAWCWHQLVQLF